MIKKKLGALPLHAQGLEEDPAVALVLPRALRLIAGVALDLALRAVADAEVFRPGHVAETRLLRRQVDVRDIPRVVDLSFYELGMKSVLASSKP